MSAEGGTDDIPVDIDGLSRRELIDLAKKNQIKPANGRSDFLKAELRALSAKNNAVDAADGDALSSAQAPEAGANAQDTNQEDDDLAAGKQLEDRASEENGSAAGDRQEEGGDDPRDKRGDDVDNVMDALFSGEEEGGEEGDGDGENSDSRRYTITLHKARCGDCLSTL